MLQAQDFGTLSHVQYMLPKVLNSFKGGTENSLFKDLFILWLLFSLPITQQQEQPQEKDQGRHPDLQKAAHP